MAKRSPILGYNHNVRYRGLVFHVQTEDSGLLNPHLFTHLFHGGVIVSTRKLVYDAGANEEAIKALMQAQHKAVMKDLKKGSFDDKIDQYLGGTPGLEPRAPGGAPTRPSGETLDEPSGALPVQSGEREGGRLSTVEEPVLELAPEPEPLAVEPTGGTAKPRTQTADRTSAPSQVRVPPAPIEDNAPTLSGDAAASVAAAVQAANAKTAPTAATTTAPLHISVRTPSGPLAGRTPTPPSIPRASTPPRPGAPLGPPIPTPPVPRRSLPQDFRIDSSPEIEISIDEDSRQRMPRDTLQNEQTIPTTIPTSDAASGPVRRVEPSPSGPRRSPTGERPASHVGATLPPAPRPAARPSITPPQVVTRPVQSAEGTQRDSDVIEVYAPAPGALDSPTERERPGQYSVNRSRNPSENVQMREQTGRMEKIEPGPPRPQARPAPPPTPAAARPSPPRASSATAT